MEKLGRKLTQQCNSSSDKASWLLKLAEPISDHAELIW